MNVINVIRPYKFGTTWVFDDPSVGLKEEAFVSGADTLIDKATSELNIRDPQKGFTMVFSGKEFPGYQFRLDWQREQYEGNWYHSKELDQEGWLCPALFRYFEKAPEQIFVQVRSRDE